MTRQQVAVAPTRPSAAVSRPFCSGLRPPGRCFHLSLAALTAAMLATGSLQPLLPAGVLFVLGLALFGLWWVIGGVWLASAVANLVRPRRRRAGWWRWVVAPPVVLLLVAGQPGVNLRFWIARPSLERLATAMAAAPPGTPAPPDQTVWFTRVSDVRRLPGGGMRFATDTGGNPFDYGGLAYSPIPLPQDQEIDSCYFTPYCGNWYTFWKR